MQNISMLLSLVCVTMGNASKVITGSPLAKQSQCEQRYEFPAGWSMFSLACQVEDPALGTHFPAATALFEFEPNSGYQRTTSIAPNKGYWINMSAPATVLLTGVPLSPCVVNFPAGWSMMGLCSKPARVADLKVATSNNLLAALGFGAGYQPATTLEPGQGYWIKLASAGVLTMVNMHRQQNFSNKSCPLGLLPIPDGKSSPHFLDKGITYPLYFLSK